MEALIEFVDGPCKGQRVRYDLEHFGHTMQVYIYSERPFYKCLYTLAEDGPGFYLATFKENVK